jgi:hypothetical protein
MLKATTKTPKVIRLKESAKIRITVKNNVDKPIIVASVPTMDSRSFQRPILISSINVHETKVTYILYSKTLKYHMVTSHGIINGKFHKGFQPKCQPMKKEKLFKLLFAPIKNSRRSDRDLAKSNLSFLTLLILLF